MDHRFLDLGIAVLATLAAVVVALMVVGVILTGSSQDFFQSARAQDAYVALLARPSADLGLRINLGLDTLFIVLYGAFFTMVAARLRSIVAPPILGVALGTMMLTALLDAYENHHIMTMAHSLETGLPVAVTDGQWQMVASQIKFHASYLSVLLFSLGFLNFGRLGRTIAAALWCYIPFGVLISVVPPEHAKLLVLLRTVFFSCAFILATILFFGQAKTADGARD